MEHPIFFLTKLLEVLGLGHFAHAYPHVTFTWLIMLLLIIFGWIATKAIQLVPYGGQNLFEAVIDGVENFQVEVMGEHGRVFFPMIATFFIFIFMLQRAGPGTGILLSYGQHQYHAGLRPDRFRHYPYCGRQISRPKIY